MKISTVFFTTLSLVISLTGNVQACTAVAFAGNKVINGGTVLAKNRDAGITGYERLSVFHPKNKIPYIALTYGNKKTTAPYPYVDAGTNADGLSVTVNDPGSHYPAHRNENKIETTTIRQILANYKSIAAVAKGAKQLFAQNDPALYTLSDHNQVASFEAGYHHQYGKKIVNNGHVWNTNYYHLTPVNNDNVYIQATDLRRAHTLKTWLAKNHQAIQLGDLTRILASHNHGRFGSIGRELTVAKYFVRTAAKQNSPSHVMVVLSIPTQKFNIYHLTIDKQFFKENPSGPINDKKYGLLGANNQSKLHAFIKHFEETAHP
jgi:hypothetical protein